MIRCMWTPNLTVLEKRTSSALLQKDKHRPIPDRVVTFEGPEHYSSNEIIVQQATSYKLACDHVHDHFKHLGVILTNANFYIKQDKQCTMYLIFITDTKFRSDSNYSLSSLPQEPLQFKLLQKNLKLDKMKKAKLFKCSLCQNELQCEEFEILINSYIHSMENLMYNMTEPASDFQLKLLDTVDGVPVAIKNSPFGTNLDYKKYQIKMNDPEFKYQSIKTCQDCYYAFKEAQGFDTNRMSQFETIPKVNNQLHKMMNPDLREAFEESKTLKDDYQSINFKKIDIENIDHDQLDLDNILEQMELRMNKLTNKQHRPQMARAPSYDSKKLMRTNSQANSRGTKSTQPTQLKISMAKRASKTPLKEKKQALPPIAKQARQILALSKKSRYELPQVSRDSRSQNSMRPVAQTKPVEYVENNTLVNKTTALSKENDSMTQNRLVSTLDPRQTTSLKQIRTQTKKQTDLIALNRKQAVSMKNIFQSSSEKFKTCELKKLSETRFKKNSESAFKNGLQFKHDTACHISQSESRLAPLYPMMNNQI